MAISPHKLQLEAIQAHIELIDETDAYITCELIRKGYTGGMVSVSLPKNDYPPVVIQEIERRYRNEGWLNVKVSSGSQYNETYYSIQMSYDMDAELYRERYEDGRMSAVIWRVVEREKRPNGSVTLERSDGKKIEVTAEQLRLNYERVGAKS